MLTLLIDFLVLTRFSSHYIRDQAQSNQGMTKPTQDQDSANRHRDMTEQRRQLQATYALNRRYF